MWEMTYIFGNWLKCLRNGQNIWENDVDLWEMAQICGEMTWLFGKLLEMWKMTERFGKCQKYLENGLDA